MSPKGVNGFCTSAMNGQEVLFFSSQDRQRFEVRGGGEKGEGGDEFDGVACRGETPEVAGEGGGVAGNIYERFRRKAGDKCYTAGAYAAPRRVGDNELGFSETPVRNDVLDPSGKEGTVVDSVEQRVLPCVLDVRPRGIDADDVL